MRAVVLLGAVAVASSVAGASPSLRFVRSGAVVKTLDLAELRRIAPPIVVATDDPYYRKKKRFTALPVAPLLEAAFGAPAATLRTEQFLLTAKDGYVVPISGARLLEAGAAIAFADRAGAWEPVGPGRADPAPFYLVWAGEAQRDLETHPRPWQLATIALVRWDEIYQHTIPPADDAVATRGARLFRERCIRCHAINQEGGRIGPDLNVPQAILEYRPEAQVRAYIRDPRTFRYSVMPPNPDLTAQSLDDLVAYFAAMQRRKHDPSAGKSPP